MPEGEILNEVDGPPGSHTPSGRRVLRIKSNLPGRRANVFLVRVVKAAVLVSPPHYQSKVMELLLEKQLNLIGGVIGGVLVIIHIPALVLEVEMCPGIETVYQIEDPPVLRAVLVHVAVVVQLGPSVTHSRSKPAAKFVHDAGGKPVDQNIGLIGIAREVERVIQSQREAMGGFGSALECERMPQVVVR